MTAPAGTYSSKIISQSAKAIVQRLQNYMSPIRQSDFFPSDVGDSRAAVLVGLTVPTSYESADELHLLLTVRSSKLNTFPSEVALPGGKADPHDKGPVETAVREAEEEIGLPRNKIEVLIPGGHMAGHVSRNGLLVTPVVALIPPMAELENTIKLNHHEVDRGGL